MKRYIGRIAVGGLVCLMLVGCYDRATPLPASSAVSQARDYLATASPKTYKVKGRVWDRGIVIRTRKVKDGFDYKFELTILTPGKAGDKKIIRSSDTDSADQLESTITLGDYIAYLPGGDNRVKTKEVKVLRAAAVDIG